MFKCAVAVNSSNQIIRTNCLYFEGDELSVVDCTVQWSLLNSHCKCTEKLCELSEHANYLSIFYVMFLSTVESCVQSKFAN